MLRRIPLALGLALLAACTDPPEGATSYTPTADMRAVLAERQSMHAKRPYDVYIGEARDIPSVTDAAQAIPNVAGRPAPLIDVKQFNQITANGAAGPLSATLYRPPLAKDTPVIIYFPGGTWAYRSDVAADETCRQLALRTGWVVVSIAPSLAPAARFPAIHDDAIAGYQWARSQLRSWGADPTRVVLAGEGPGANLALSTALAVRDRAVAGSPVAIPDQLLLITPWAGTSTGGDSMAENAGAQPLNRASVRWAQRAYASGSLDDPRIDLADRTDLQGMPPTLVILADIDPLRSGAETLAAHLQAAGTRTDIRRYRGVTYEFFGLGTYVAEAARAETDAARALAAGFNTTLARQ